MIHIYAISIRGYETLSLILPKWFHTIDCVITADESDPSEDYGAPIRKLCKNHGVKCESRKLHKRDTNYYGIVIGWKWMIKEDRNLIVIHDSLLPKYRGFNPLVTALINGDQHIGITAFFANNYMDAGPIIYQTKTRISYPITIQQALQSIIPMYVQTVETLISNIIQNKTLESTEQIHSLATYSVWRDNSDYYIDWSQNSSKIVRQIHATGSPYAGSRTLCNGKLVYLMDAIDRPEYTVENPTPGKVLTIDNGFPVVICGLGCVAITHALSEDGRSLLPWKRTRVRFTL